MGTAPGRLVAPSELTQAHDPVSPLCRQLAEVVQERYLSGAERARMHGVLADFFSGAWSQGTKKLITLPLVGKPLNLDRMVSCWSGIPALGLPRRQGQGSLVGTTRLLPSFPPRMPS